MSYRAPLADVPRPGLIGLARLGLQVPPGAGQVPLEGRQTLAVVHPVIKRTVRLLVASHNDTADDLLSCAGC